MDLYNNQLTMNDSYIAPFPLPSSILYPSDLSSSTNEEESLIFTGHTYKYMYMYALVYNLCMCRHVPGK